MGKRWPGLTTTQPTTTQPTTTQSSDLYLQPKSCPARCKHHPTHPTKHQLQSIRPTHPTKHQLHTTTCPLRRSCISQSKHQLQSIRPTHPTKHQLQHFRPTPIHTTTCSHRPGRSKSTTPKHATRRLFSKPEPQHHFSLPSSTKRGTIHSSS